MSLPRTSLDFVNDIEAEIAIAVQFVDGFTYETFESIAHSGH